ncbi:MAG: hypothetical protein KJ949_02330, partial [Nanoarchaeota archaeon]|nr:hypothetical protein [Nanoarchaeota archaeon]
MKKEGKIIFCLSLVLILSLSLVSAGWFSNLFGGTGNIVMTSCDPDIGGSCPTGYKCEAGICVKCVPKTCSDLEKECGTWSDGCGVNLNCGTCETNFNCVEGVCVIKGMEDYACYVSDGGRNMYEKGILYSYGKKIGEEYCTDSSTAVSEGYCTPNGGATSDDVGVNYGQSIKCPNGCVDGACVADEVCCKSWGIDPNGMEINVKYGFIRKTKCGVSEDFVEGGKEIVDSLYCCLDSDNGFDYYVEGTCSDSSGNSTDFYSGTALIEYYCLNNVCSAAAPFVCEKGEGNACLVLNETEEELEEIIQIGCSDLNGKNLSVSVFPGKRMNEEGVIYYCDVFSLEFKEAKQKEEICGEDYECISNDCSAGKCSSVYEEIGKQTELINEQGSFLKKIWCGILHPVDVTKRNQEGETVENNGWFACVISESDKECYDTCEILDYECGFQKICEEEVSCGTCEEGYKCNEGKCGCIESCLSLGYECGVQNVCGEEVNCGVCVGSENCQDGLCKTASPFLLIGGRSAGLSSCDSSGNCTSGSFNSIGSMDIGSMAVYDDKLWIGQYKGILQSCDSSGNCTKEITPPINGEGTYYSIKSMAVYDDKLWIGSSKLNGFTGFLYSYFCDSLGNCTPKKYSGSFNSLDSMAVYNNKLWISSEFGTSYLPTLISCDSLGNCT